MLFAFLPWSTPVATAQNPVTQAGVPAFRVGDAVRIAVWDSPQLSGQFEIAEDGTVIHPLYRGITLAGLSLPEAEAAFRRLLQRFQNDPEFVVEPLFRVPVSGEVNSPSIYTLPPQATLAQALNDAGGLTSTANPRRARLIREGRETVVDLTRPNNEFAIMRVRSGDQIIIDRRTSIWRDHLEPGLRTAGSLASLAYLFIRINSGR